MYFSIIIKYKIVYNRNKYWTTKYPSSICIFINLKVMNQQIQPIQLQNIQNYQPHNYDYYYNNDSANDIYNTADVFIN